MICPQTKAGCDCPDRCQLVMPPQDASPTLAEIERLVDALVDAAIYSDVPDAQAARAALMAAIRLYVQE